MEVSKSRQKPKPEDAGDDYTPEYEDYTEIDTINSMIPIWKRRKSDVSQEEYNEFYKSDFHDFADPARTISIHAEGALSYDALLFVPSRPAVRPVQPATTRRAWPCTAPTCSSWRSARSCCLTTSTSCAAWSTARTSR